MARIRTIKPEFWTDEIIVQLPFEARLLFIGLWNFADDAGYVDFSPERIRMQVFPGDPNVDVGALVDLLVACGRLAYWVEDEGGKIIEIVHWLEHQKIDNPSRKTIRREGYRKVSIPGEARIRVAEKYGCKPGSVSSAACYYCGAPGQVHWFLNSRGKPSRWVALSDLEFDHFVSEHSGGESTGENIVLACRSCNRAKREFSPISFFKARNSIGLDNPREPSPLEGKGLEGIGEEGKGEGVVGAVAPVPVSEAFDEWNRMAADTGLPMVQNRSRERQRALKARLTEVGGIDGWRDALAKIRGSPFLLGQHNSPKHPNWRADFDFIVTPKQFTKLMEGGYDTRVDDVRKSDSDRLRAGLAAAFADVAGQSPAD